MPVMTVQGPVDAEKLGIVTIHEHLLIDLRNQFREFSEVSKNAIAEQEVNISNLGILRRNPLAIRDNLVINDVKTAEEEVLAFKGAGGDTIVDATNIGIGRDPRALRSISRHTGVNIITGCGYYYHDTHPSDMGEKSVDYIAQEMVDDMRKGIDETDIKAGVIGELGLSQEIHPDEKKVLLAAAQANSETGAGIIVHTFDWSKTGGYPAGIEAAEILKSGGADMKKVAIGHLDVAMDINLDYILKILDTGACAEFDNFGHEFYVNREDRKFLPGPFATDIERVRTLKKLIDKGFLRRIVISNDICHKSMLKKYGGWGYEHLLTNIIPMMLDEGITYEQINVILRENHRDFLNRKS